MKYFLLLFIIIHIQLKAQSIKVVGNDNKPVSYSHVVINEKNGFVADSMGVLLFNCKINDNDTIVTSCIGYKSDTSIWSDIKKNNLIVLSLNIYMLNEALVSTNKIQRKTLVFGNKKHNSSFQLDCGSEIACRINPQKENSIIKSISYYIKKDGIPTNPFRVKLYCIDSITKIPGNILVDSNMIINADKGGTWVTIEFDKNIYIPAEGFFVSMEWLPSAKRYKEEVIENNATIVASGQVLGGNKINKKRGTLEVYKRWFPETKWERTDFWNTLPAIQVTIEFFE